MTVETKFIHETNPALANSQEVTTVVDFLNTSGDSIPNSPDDKIDAYLGFLAANDLVNDGVVTGDRQSVLRQVDAQLIESEKLEPYFKRLRERAIANNLEFPEFLMSDALKSEEVKRIQGEQRGSLVAWAEYLNHGDYEYPEWFKFYAWNGVLKLGDFDVDRGEFRKRSKGTVSPFPAVDAESLASVYDVVLRHRIQGEAMTDEDPGLQKMMENPRFEKLYGYFVADAQKIDQELLNETEGEWITFEQSELDEDARALSDFLKDKNTGWCTATESTAKGQLEDGDFYIFATKDTEGKFTTPRVAIRTENQEVVEVRGINSGQEIEVSMLEAVGEKLPGLPGGDNYEEKIENTQRISALYNRLVTEGDSFQMDADELRWLYQIDGPIDSFGYDEHTLIGEILLGRDIREDMKVIFPNDTGKEIDKRILDIIPRSNREEAHYLQGQNPVRTERNISFLLNHIDEHTSDPMDVVDALISKGHGMNVMQQLHKIRTLSHYEAVSRLIKATVPVDVELLDDLDLSTDESMKLHMLIDDDERERDYVDYYESEDSFGRKGNEDDEDSYDNWGDPGGSSGFDDLY